MHKYLQAAAATSALLLAAGIVGMYPSSPEAQTINQFQSQRIDRLCAPAQGQVLYRSATGWTCLAPGTNGQVLTTAGAGANPAWGASTGTSVGTSGATVGLLNANNTYSGVSTFTGSIARAIRTITGAGDVTVSATTDYFLCVNKTVGAATAVNLPATPATGLTYVIKDCKGDATTNNITITPAAGNIDGAATLVIVANSISKQVIYNGTQWVSY